MSVLEKLREKNPGLPLFSVEDEAFAPYGRVLGSADAELSAALAETELPAEGNLYHASEPSLEALPLMPRLRRLAFGEMEIQAGFCNGRGFTLNALEYHKCSEVNYSTTGLVLLLALPADLEGDSLDAGRIKGFYLPPETLVEIYPRTLHFAPAACGRRALPAWWCWKRASTPRWSGWIPPRPGRKSCCGCRASGCSATRTRPRPKRAPSWGSGAKISAWRSDGLRNRK